MCTCAVLACKSIYLFQLIWFFAHVSILCSNGNSRPATQGSARTTGPIELPTHDAVLSLAWLPDKSDILLAGTGSKFLRLFDIKVGNAIHTVPTARGANHLAVDPHSKNQVASFSRSDVSQTTRILLYICCLIAIE